MEHKLRSPEGRRRYLRGQASLRFKSDRLLARFLHQMVDCAEVGYVRS